MATIEVNEHKQADGVSVENATLNDYAKNIAQAGVKDGHDSDRIRSEIVKRVGLPLERAQEHERRAREQARKK